MNAVNRLVSVVAGLAMAALAASGAIAQVTALGGTPEGASKVNPVPTTAESLEAGRVLYLSKCAACHGELGDGHGKAAGEYGKPPADLTQTSYKYGTTDGDVFDVIQNGVQPGLSMPAWDGLMNETDMWKVVIYLRTLRKS